MNLRLLVPLIGALAMSVSAAVVDVNLPWKNLQLKNGLLFPDATVRSVNTSAGTALLLIDKDLISVRTSQLPDDLAAKLKAITPLQTTEEMAEARAQEAAERKRAGERAERRQQQAEEEARAARAANRDLNVKAAAATAARYEAIPAEVARFAEQRARAYFRYQADPHSNIGVVVNSDIVLPNPEPVHDVRRCVHGSERGKNSEGTGSENRRGFHSVGLPFGHSPRPSAAARCMKSI